MLRHCFFLLLLCFLALGSSAGNVLAQEDGDVPDDALSQYQALETIPGVTTKGKSTELPTYLTSLFNFAIAIVGIAALVMITIGGFWYLTSAGNASRVSTAKSMVTDAILGLLVALFAWLILNTINPQLVSRGLSGFSLDPVAEQPDNRLSPNQKYCADKSLTGFEESRCFDSESDCESAQIPVYDAFNCVLTSIVGTDVIDPTEDQFRQALGDVEYCYTYTRPAAFSQPEIACTSNYSTCLSGSVAANNGTPCVIRSTDPSVYIAADLVAEHQRHMVVAEMFYDENITINENFPRTSVADLGIEAIDGVIQLNLACPACGVHVTGGTEPGHATHGPNQSIVDLRLTPELENYLPSNASGPPTQNTRGEDVYTFTTGPLAGARATRESTHWHVSWE